MELADLALLGGDQPDPGKLRLEPLKGSVVMQLKGGEQITLDPGQTFYEGPDDVHLVDRNASATQPAKFLVLLIKNKGAPALVPAD